MTGKRVCLAIQEKLWIIKHSDDNENIEQTKIAVDFQAKFNRPITRLSISQVGNDEIVPVKLWQRANWSKFPRRYTSETRCATALCASALTLIG